MAHLGNMIARVVVGRNLKARRTELGLSQDELGSRAGTSGNYIGMIERGETSVSIDMLEAIAEALGVTVSDLVSSD